MPNEKNEAPDPSAASVGYGYGVKAMLLFIAGVSVGVGAWYSHRIKDALGQLTSGAPSLSRIGRWLYTLAINAGMSGAGAALYAQLLTKVLWALLVFVLLLVAVFALGRLLGKFITRSGEFSLFLFPITTTRNSRTTGVLIIITGILVGVIPAYLLIRHEGWLSLLTWLPFIAGVGIALISVGIAVTVPLPMLLDPARPFQEAAKPSPEPGAARITGEEFLNLLRRSPIFRRQIHFESVLNGSPFLAEPEGLQQLLRRFPRLEPVLEHIEFSQLSHDQTHALSTIRHNEESGKPMDYIFIGHAGSGRTTMANLMALGAALQKEGAIYCITPESPDQAIDYDSEKDRRAVRHAATQLREWIARSGLSDVVNVSESYRAAESPREVDSGADIIVTDARVFSRSNEARTERLLSRLRYVIVDQPERLSREDFVKLRIALCRLRLVAELMGRPLTYIVILPRLNNSAEVGKYLLNHSNVESLPFGSWTGPCRMVGWVPALEIADLDDDSAPRFARASFIDEVRALLTEIGWLANDLPQKIRVAVIDQHPLLGPEAREDIREAVRDQIARMQHDQTPMMRTAWTYFTGSDVGVERQGEFDVVICLGAGRYPRETVAAIRPAVAADGVVIVVADSSPADLDTFDRISAASWSPETDTRRYPTLLLPDHSDAVLAYELARLFEDFSKVPLPVDRLLQVFPGRNVQGLLDEWREKKAFISDTEVFEDLHEGNWPRRRKCLKLADRAFRGDLYEIPWGCCSRNVYDVYDRAANRQVAAGAYLNDWIDADRLFIDFHPMAVLRYRPNTVLVAKIHKSTVPEGTVPDTRFVQRGTVEIHQMLRDDAIRIDRRNPRIATEVMREWSPDSKTGTAFSGDGEVPAMAPLLRTGEGGEAAAVEITQRMARLRVTATNVPPLTLIGGEWYAQIHEQVRDVVRTDARLVEEPDFTTAVSVSASSVTAREYECAVISLFIQKSDSAVTTRGDRPKEAPEKSFEDYPSYHAFSRLIAEHLRRDFLGFDHEYRVAVIDSKAEVDGVSQFRIVVYKLRSEELGWDHTLASMLEPEDLGDLLLWAHERLIHCDCVNGCSRCCGGLGTTPAGTTRLRHFTDADVISRSGAYELVCGLLGRTADWQRFREAARSALPIGTLSDRQLARFVDELIGTSAGMFRDGVWWKDLFGSYMELEQPMLATASWMAGESDRPNFSGYYVPLTNQIFIRPEGTLSWIKETIIHEFVHNWQFRAGRFDLDTYLTSPSMRQYFDGKLVIEGHAVWSEHLYRLHMRQGPVYSHTDGRPWDEYKAGYLLMEGIEKVVGQEGLFAWLIKGEKPSHIRSRDPRLVWPFTLDQALDKLDLRQYVRAEAFTGFDVDDDKPAEDEAVPPTVSG